MISRVTKVLIHSFEENTTEDLIEGIVWEAHKALVRGELISLGFKLKKACQADFQRVLCVLQQAELRQKHSGDPEALSM